MASSNFVIGQSKNFLPLYIRKTLYNSLFKSHLEFGILMWGRAAPSKLKRIFNQQKKCIRNVAGKGVRSHTDPLFSDLNILKFEDLFLYNCSSFMNKYILNLLPKAFDDFFYPLSEPNRTNGFKLEKTKNKNLEKFPSVFLPKIWNDNSLLLKSMISHKSFTNARSWLT